MSELLERSPFNVASERRIVIVADWLPPDFGAVGQYMQMRAKALAEQGHDVTLIGLSSKAPSTTQENIGAGRLTEIRLAARPVPRGSLVGRLLWTAWTNLRLVLGAFRYLRAADGILFTGSPPFLIHLLVPLKWLWKGKLIYRITDFHPECLIAAQAIRSRPLEALLALTNMWRRHVEGFEVLGVDQLRRLLDTGIPESRIALVRDGSPVSFIAGQVPEPLPSELEGHCALLYSGNYGVAHEVDTVFEGYRRHHQEGSGRVWLWLSAAGAGAEDLVRRFTAAKLPFHKSAPVPLERLPGLLFSPDAHLVTLKDSFVGFVMPSKIYACIDSGRPIIFVGSRSSDVDLLTRNAPRTYWQVSCGNPAGFAAALEELADKSGRSCRPARA
jgi:hypothetical protein